jgi:hypothetical protein
MFSKRQLPAGIRRTSILALVGLALVLGVAACGGGASESTASLPPSNLLRPSEISHYPAGSVQRSFLQFWSDLQFRSWADAVAFYDPRFRKFVGTATVISAKKANASAYPLLKPQIVRVGTNPTDTTIFYTVRLAEGTKELASTTWLKEGGNWEMIYDSRLDAELGQLARDRTEIERTGSPPSATKQPSPRAARVANEAEQLQARFLQQELNTGKP